MKKIRLLFPVPLPGYSVFDMSRTATMRKITVSRTVKTAKILDFTAFLSFSVAVLPEILK